MKTENKIRFGERVKARREELGLSQAELSRRVGYTSRSTIGKIEIGESDVSRDKIIALANALQTTPEYLIGWDEKSTKINTQTIGDRIRERREELDISVSELAKRLGKNRATVYRYESNDIEDMPSSMLEPLAKALQTTPEYLMGWDEKNTQMNTQTIGDRIRERRLKLGLSGAELAKRIGIPKSTMFRYEGEYSDNIPIDIIRPLARILQTTPEYLMGWDEKNTQMNSQAMEYSESLKRLRKQKGITQQELADILCVDKTSISKWENGANYPNQNIQVLIADYFGVSVDYMLGRDNLPPYKNIYPLEPYIKLPVLGVIRAGQPICTDQNSYDDWEFADAKYNDGKHYILRVQGDSMYPIIPNGSIAIIRIQNTAEKGQIVAFAFDGEYATLKRYFPQPNGSILLRADNPNADSYVVTQEQIKNSEAFILGVCCSYKVNL